MYTFTYKHNVNAFYFFFLIFSLCFYFSFLHSHIHTLTYFGQVLCPLSVLPSCLMCFFIFSSFSHLPVCVLHDRMILDHQRHLTDPSLFRSLSLSLHFFGDECVSVSHLGKNTTAPHWVILKDEKMITVTGGDCTLVMLNKDLFPFFFPFLFFLHYLKVKNGLSSSQGPLATSAIQ